MKGLGILSFIILSAIVACSWWSAAIFPLEVGPNNIHLLWLLSALMTFVWVVVIGFVMYRIEPGRLDSILIIKMLLVAIGTAIYTSIWWIAAIFDVKLAWGGATILTFSIVFFGYCWISDHWDDK